MKIKLVIILFAIYCLISTAKAQTINTEKSIVTFEIDNMKVNTTKGAFKGMKGILLFNPTDLDKSNFNVCIDASTVNTDNEKRNHHLRNEDFFNVSKFPTICFVSESIVKTQAGYAVSGNLNLHGVTKKVIVPFSYDTKNLKGTFKINRLDYSLGAGTGTFMVSNEVTITITCVVAP